jgi:hypothetical protein
MQIRGSRFPAHHHYHQPTPFQHTPQPTGQWATQLLLETGGRIRSVLVLKPLYLYSVIGFGLFLGCAQPRKNRKSKRPNTTSRPAMLIFHVSESSLPATPDKCFDLESGPGSTRKWTKTCKTHRYPQTWSLFGHRDNCPIFDFLGTTGPNLNADFEVCPKSVVVYHILHHPPLRAYFPFPPQSAFWLDSRSMVVVLHSRQLHHTR